MNHFHIFVLFFILSCQRFAVRGFESEETDGKLIECGMYGFRCLDKKRAQICDKNKFEVDESEPRQRIFECANGLTCDEDKKEFCAPEKLPCCNCSNTKRKFQEVQKFRVRKRARDDFFDDVFEPTKATTLKSFVDDDDEEETEKPDVDPWNGNPPITCTSHGFFPGSFHFLSLKISIPTSIPIEQTSTTNHFSSSATSREVEKNLPCDT